MRLRLLAVNLLVLSFTMGCGSLLEFEEPEDEALWEPAKLDETEKEECDTETEAYSSLLKLPENYVEETYLPTGSQYGPYQINNVVTKNHQDHPGGDCRFQLRVTYQGSRNLYITFGSKPTLSQVFTTWKVADFNSFGFSPPTSDSVTISLDNGYSVGDTGTFKTLSKESETATGHIDVLAEDVELMIDGYGTPQYKISFALKNYDDGGEIDD